MCLFLIFAITTVFSNSDEKTLETVLESKVSLAKQENENKIDDNSNVRGSSQNLVTLRTDAKANDNNEEIGIH